MQESRRQDLTSQLLKSAQGAANACEETTALKYA